nr:hypothetical protein CTI12_AA035240 [Ipomoea batatas]
MVEKVSLRQESVSRLETDRTGVRLGLETESSSPPRRWRSVLRTGSLVVRDPPFAPGLERRHRIWDELSHDGGERADIEVPNLPVDPVELLGRSPPPLPVITRSNFYAVERRPSTRTGSHHYKDRLSSLLDGCGSCSQAPFCLCTRRANLRPARGNLCTPQSFTFWEEATPIELSYLKNCPLARVLAQGAVVRILHRHVYFTEPLSETVAQILRLSVRALTHPSRGRTFGGTLRFSGALDFLTNVCVTQAGHSRFRFSTCSRGGLLTKAERSPTDVFLHPTASADRLGRASSRPRRARSVSYTSLFQGWLLLGKTSWLSLCTPYLLFSTERSFRGLSCIRAVSLSTDGAYPPSSRLADLTPVIWGHISIQSLLSVGCGYRSSRPHQNSALAPNASHTLRRAEDHPGFAGPLSSDNCAYEDSHFAMAPWVPLTKPLPMMSPAHSSTRHRVRAQAPPVLAGETNSSSETKNSSLRRAWWKSFLQKEVRLQAGDGGTEVRLRPGDGGSSPTWRWRSVSGLEKETSVSGLETEKPPSPDLAW